MVEQGSPKAAFQFGINKNDFDIFSDEFDWLERRYGTRKPITRRLFCERFPDFEFVLSKEKIDDLLEEFKTERAYSSLASLIESVSETLLPENSIETAEHMREVLSEVLKSFSPHSDISMQDHSRFFERAKQRRILAQNGETTGMPFLIPSLDYHWDGLNQGRLIALLGRPGEGKSYTIAYVGWIAIKLGFAIGIFSPEMDEFEHGYRMHTLASADPEVQKACGLSKSFHNRDLMRGTGFDLKAYKRFCEYFDSLPGSCHIFTKKYRQHKITTQYIAARIEDLGLHGIVADPISKISSGLKRNDNAVWESYDKVQVFQELVKEHNVFGIATNWSTRQQGKQRSEKAPDLDDSFGSDALAQESDHVMGVKHDDEDRTLTFRCSKSRFSKPRFNVVIDFHPNTGHWKEVNIAPDVLEYRMTLNGHVLQNGTAGDKRSKPAKARKKVTA